MCGLVGIWRHDGGEADRSAIDLMLATIPHRGPDGMGAWQEGRVALGHRRLSIIDLTEAAAQPMLTEDWSGVLIYNGEVYNYREMRRELEQEGAQFRSTGDTEVVLQALSRWGPQQSVERFNGMFAFAYLDRREGALWLARDRIGIKPLLVADTGAELIFGSEAKALLAHPRMTRRLDRYAMAQWLLRHGRTPRGTFFAGIDQLEPGSLWKVTDKGIEKQRYFHALTEVDVDRLLAAGSGDPARFIAGFRNLLKKSVKLHLASDAPLAAMCSGGVDSSLIAAYANEEVPDLLGYVADIPWADGEGDQGERVGRHLGIPVRRILVDQGCFLRLWPYAIWHSDAPTTHPSDAALLAVAQTSRADGIKVLLTGEGSDELFGGYLWQSTTYDRWRAKTWTRFFRRRGRKGEASSLAPFEAWPANGKLGGRLSVSMDADQSLLPKRLFELLAPVRPAADRAFLAHCLSSLYGHLGWILFRHDRIGMAASIEMRVPFLENNLFDFAFHLPRRAKLQRRVGKWVVKRAAAETLPADVVYARKKGFPVPEAFWAGTQQLIEGGVLAEVMQWSSDTTGDVLAILANDKGLQFHLVGIELWLRMAFGGETPQALGEKVAAVAAHATSELGKMPAPKRRMPRLWRH
jgi:asparagine synthase (glutamine-hydrolysing)